MEITLNRHGYAFKIAKKAKFPVMATIQHYKQAERQVVRKAITEFLGRELTNEDCKKIEILQFEWLENFGRLEDSTLAYNGEPIGRIKTEFSISPDGEEEVRVEFWPQ